MERESGWKETSSPATASAPRRPDHHRDVEAGSHRNTARRGPRRRGPGRAHRARKARPARHGCRRGEAQRSCMCPSCLRCARNSASSTSDSERRWRRSRRRNRSNAMPVAESATGSREFAATFWAPAGREDVGERHADEILVDVAGEFPPDDAGDAGSSCSHRPRCRRRGTVRTVRPTRRRCP